MGVATGARLTCPECSVVLDLPAAEDLALDSAGACTTCQGTGFVREIDAAALVPDERSGTAPVGPGVHTSGSAARDEGTGRPVSAQRLEDPHDLGTGAAGEPVGARMRAVGAAHHARVPDGDAPADGARIRNRSGRP
ncbi:hypothetical protein ACI8AK_18925 [Geodermatophilus sp. SYSU D00867]